MTTGSRYRDSRTTDGHWQNIVWSGGNDPTHKKAENNYSKTTDEGHHNLLQKWWLTPTRHFASQGYDGYGTEGRKPSWNANSELALLSKVVQEARGHDFNAGVFMGEFRKTLDSLKRSATAFFNVYRAFKHGDVSGAIRSMARLVHGDTSARSVRKREKYLLSKVKGKRGLTTLRESRTGRERYVYPKDLNLQDVSSMWLALQYGWKPLLTDVYEAAKYIEQVTAPPRVLKSVFGKSQPTYYLDDAATLGGGYSFMMAMDVRRSYRVYWTEQLSTTRSLGLENPLSVAWEVTPLSFVVDWFIPIGTYLDNLSIIPKLTGNFHRSTKYVSQGYKPRTACTPGNGPHGWPHDAYCCPYQGNSKLAELVGGGSYARRVWFNRETYVSLSVPLPSLKSLDKALSLGHLENAAGLIHQLISNHR